MTVFMISFCDSSVFLMNCFFVVKVPVRNVNMASAYEMVRLSRVLTILHPSG